MSVPMNELPARELLTHFLATVDDYRRFNAALPLPQTINLFGQPEFDRWTVVAHAMMLRKYFSGDPNQPKHGDHLNLNAVVRALRELSTDAEISDESWDGMENHAKSILPIALYFVGGVEMSAEDIARDEIYSRYLHGNPVKWGRRVTSAPVVDQALFYWASIRSSRLLSLESLVREQFDKLSAPLGTSDAPARHGG
jgi:hypothetical protein